MDDVRLPDIGQQLRVKRTREDPELYRSRLVDAGDTDLWLALPILAESPAHQTMPVTAADTLWVEYATDGYLYGFAAKVLDVVDVPYPTWRVSRPKPDEVVRLQRREFVREEAALPVELEMKGEDGTTRRTRALSRDISGGGLAVVCTDPAFNPEPGARLMVRFRLPLGDFPVQARCVVVRVVPFDVQPGAGVTGRTPELSSGGTGSQGAEPAPEPVPPRVLSLQYSDLDEKVRQRIIQFTFQRQRVRRK